MSETQSNIPSPTVLTLEFDAPELNVSDLSDLVSDLKAMVTGLHTPNEPRNVQVRWMVQSVSKSSPLRIELLPKGYQRNQAVDTPYVSDLPHVAIAGINDLLMGVRPSTFNDQALGHVRGLFERASKRSGTVRLVADSSSIELTGGIASAVGRILDPSYHAFGTVEGKLELINMHGDRPIFAIYDDLTSKRINCSFGKSVSLPQAAGAITRRVAVEGEISYRSDGNIVRIAAERLTEFPPDAMLPSADDVLGILSA